jgi:hypothetical protein
MNYDDEEVEERGFKTSLEEDDEEFVEPPEETDFGLDEEDPDRER